jgi:hypothetical protein
VILHLGRCQKASIAMSSLPPSAFINGPDFCVENYRARAMAVTRNFDEHSAVSFDGVVAGRRVKPCRALAQAPR